MVYVDLNVRATTRVSAGELQRLGYGSICVNVDCEAGQKPKDASHLPDLPRVPQREKSGKTAKKAKLYTASADNALQVQATTKQELPRQFKRITLQLDDMPAAQALCTSAAVKSYDLVAAETSSPKVFQFLCEHGEVDLLTFDITNRIPFQIKRPWIDAAIKRGLYLEVTYTPCLGDAAGRRYFFSNASNLVRLTGGKHLVFSSGASRDILLRSPYDVVNVGLLVGLKYGQALDAVSTSCMAVLEHADRRRGLVGGVAVDVSDEDVAMQE